jgi:hypothetical protein
MLIRLIPKRLVGLVEELRGQEEWYPRPQQETVPILDLAGAVVTAGGFVGDNRISTGLPMKSDSCKCDPVRDVFYIFERDGTRGGALWLLVLACGHIAVRKRTDPKNLSAISQAMFRPIGEFLAPRRVRCHHCESGAQECDPAILVRALGGRI